MPQEDVEDQGADHVPIVKAKGLLGFAELYASKYGMLSFGTFTVIGLIITLQVFFWGPMMEQVMLAIDTQRGVLEEQRLLLAEQKSMFERREALVRRDEQIAEQMNRGIQQIDALITKVLQARN